MRRIVRISGLAMDDLANIARFEAQLDDERTRYLRDMRRSREVYEAHLRGRDTDPSPPPEHIRESQR
jgi:hypothetical protein